MGSNAMVSSMGMSAMVPLLLKLSIVAMHARGSQPPYSPLDNAGTTGIEFMYEFWYV